MSKKIYKKPQVTIEQLEQQLMKANLELLQANRQLETEKKSRAELLSNLSHDLRAPLTAIRSTVELMQSKKSLSPDEQHILLDIMNRRLRMLETMMNDLFLLTCVENPSIKPELESLNAGIFLEEFFYSCKVDNRFANRSLKINVPENFPYCININVQQMLRVLDNLFTNALRYSDDDDTITLGAYKQEDNAICIYVEDTGEGISPEDISHIFERSFRADKSRTPSNAGAGLGLAIAKAIIEQHEGRICCESSLGAGSKFLIELPCTNELNNNYNFC